jgi:hypothetical protein
MFVPEKIPIMRTILLHCIQLNCNNVAPVTNLCLGRATTRSHSSGVEVSRTRSKQWIKLSSIQWTTSVHCIHVVVQKLSTGQICFILDNFFQFNLVQIKFYPVEDNFCTTTFIQCTEVVHWIDDLSTVLNNRAQRIN